MINYLKEEAFGITKRILKRDFRGNTGQAVKNTIYQFFTTLIAKGGGIVFTIILARLLMPELFGLYSLALSTIILFSSFSDFGIGTALIRFLSREFGKKKGNPKGYFLYLRKAKAILVSISALLLVSSAYFVSNMFYNKPIFYALLAGGLYILVNQFMNFFSGIFFAQNNFKRTLIREAVFEIARIILVPLVVLLTITQSSEDILFWIILALTTSYLISFLVLISFKRKFKGKKLNKKQKREVNKFILPLSATALSGLFMGNIDKIMLGRYISAEFIGYYAAAFTLIGSAGALIAFSGALFPIFARLEGSRLNRGLKKAIFVTLPVAILAFIGTILVAKYVILIIYGADYSSSILLLQILSPLLITASLTGIYSNYFIAKGRTKLIAKLLISTTILNIILNYIFIQYGLQFSFYIATIGAAVATIISRTVYLIGLVVARSKKNE